MKKAKTEKTEVNFLKPAVIPEVDPEDCFGQEYDPRDKDCSLCSDIDFCGIVHADKVKKKIKQTEQESGPYLDQTDFASVNWKKIEEKAKEYEDAGEPMTFEELTEAISTIAKTKDEIAVTEFIRRELPKTTLNIKAGNVYITR